LATVGGFRWAEGCGEGEGAEGGGEKEFEGAHRTGDSVILGEWRASLMSGKARWMGKCGHKGVGLHLCIFGEQGFFIYQVLGCKVDGA
jgi:hypothetical protein